MSEFLDAKGKFKCTACGACCRNVWPLINKGFPRQWVNKRGGCTNQMKSGKCRIYERRPAICRLENTLKGMADKDIAQFCETMKQHEASK